MPVLVVYFVLSTCNHVSYKILGNCNVNFNDCIMTWESCIVMVYNSRRHYISSATITWSVKVSMQEQNSMLWYECSMTDKWQTMSLGFMFRGNNGFRSRIQHMHLVVLKWSSDQLRLILCVLRPAYCCDSQSSASFTVTIKCRFCWICFCMQWWQQL